MTGPQIYLLILVISSLTGFIPWLFIQLYSEREIFWSRIAVFGFISTIITILIGIFYLINWVAELF